MAWLMSADWWYYDGRGSPDHGCEPLRPNGGRLNPVLQPVDPPCPAGVPPLGGIVRRIGRRGTPDADGEIQPSNRIGRECPAGPLAGGLDVFACRQDTTPAGRGGLLTVAPASASSNPAWRDLLAQP